MAPSVMTKLRLRKPTCLAVPMAAYEPSPEPAKIASVVPICEILPQFLFLGGIADACNEAALSAFSITHILSLTYDADKITAKGIVHKHVPMEDSPEEDIASHFEECFGFIKVAQDCGGHLLIHCQMGISRAPTIVIAYLMKHHHYSFSAALSHVKAKRSIISPRLSFLFVLEAYEKALHSEENPGDMEGFSSALGSLKMNQRERSPSSQEAPDHWGVANSPAFC